MSLGNVNKSKSFFFDRQAVIKAADKQTRAVLSKFGSFVRRTAKGLIRNAGKKGASSRPGQPPKSHNGMLKKFLFFVFDPARQSVIIGPAKLNGTISDNCPAVLEKGGTTKVRVWQNHQKVVKKVHVEARPYMGPAVSKEIKQLPSLWANSVQR